MTCPHCNYEHGWNNEKLEDIKGKLSKFFVLPIEAIKQDLWNSEIKRASLYA